MIDELVAGIKNAMERGYSIEQAAQSFVNAGYNPAEVKEAINILTSGATAILESGQPEIQPREVPQQSLSGQEAQASVQQALQQNKIFSATNPRKRKLMIALIILLIALIGGLILIIIFKYTLLNFISGTP